jgi:hypothetical protein
MKESKQIKADSMPEKWRRIPGTKAEISSLAHVRTRRGALLTPIIFKDNKDWRKRAGYRFKDGGQRCLIYPQIVMPEVWPELEPEIFDKRWALKVREKRNLSRPVPLDASGTTWRGGEIRDPWDEMSLWNKERDYFSWAQYCPCL